MSTATVFDLVTRRKWVPIEYCRRCGEARPVDHRTHRLEVVK